MKRKVLMIFLGVLLFNALQLYGYGFPDFTRISSDFSELNTMSLQELQKLKEDLDSSPLKSAFAKLSSKIVEAIKARGEGGASVPTRGTSPRTTSTETFPRRTLPRRLPPGKTDLENLERRFERQKGRLNAEELNAMRKELENIFPDPNLSKKISELHEKINTAKKVLEAKSKLEYLERRFAIEKGRLDVTGLKMMRGDLRILGNSIDQSLKTRFESLMRDITAQIDIVDRATKKVLQGQKELEDLEKQFAQKKGSLNATQLKNMQRELEGVFIDLSLGERLSALHGEITAQIAIVESKEAGIVDRGARPGQGPKKPVQRVKISTDEPVLDPERSSARPPARPPVAPRGEPRIRQTRTLQEILRERIGWLRRPEVRVQTLLNWARNNNKIIAERVLNVGGIINNIFQLSIPNQYSGTLGALGLGNICGPMSARSCYYLNQYFRVGTRFSERLNLLNSLTSMPDATSTFESLAEKLGEPARAKLHNIDITMFDDIWTQKNIEGLPRLADIKPSPQPDENLYVLDGVSGVVTKGPAHVGLVGLLQGKDNGFSCSLIWLMRGQFEKALGITNIPEDQTLDQLYREGVSHWICIFVVKANNQFNWFILDSLNGNNLEHVNVWQKIEFLIYKLNGASTQSLDYNDDFEEGKKRFEALGDLVFQFSYLRSLSFELLIERIARLLQIGNILISHDFQEKINNFLEVILDRLNTFSLQYTNLRENLVKIIESLRRILDYRFIRTNLRTEAQDLLRRVRERIEAIDSEATE